MKLQTPNCTTLLVTLTSYTDSASNSACTIANAAIKERGMQRIVTTDSRSAGWARCLTLQTAYPTILPMNLCLVGGKRHIVGFVSTATRLFQN